MVLKIGKAVEFDSLVSSAPVALVDFYAVWYGPCRTIAPVLDDMEQRFEAAGRPVKFFKVDVDENAELVEKMGITAMPTFHIYKNGRLEKQVIGAQMKVINETIDHLLSDVAKVDNADEEKVAVQVE